MIDIEKLKADREKASEDKADLFDFYHDNWDSLIEALEAPVFGVFVNDVLMDMGILVGVVRTREKALTLAMQQKPSRGEWVKSTESRWESARDYVEIVELTIK